MQDNDKMFYEVPRLESIDMPFVVKGDGEQEPPVPVSQAVVPEPFEDIDF